MSFVENINKLATAITQPFIDSINIVKANEASITTVGQNISDVTAVADSVVPNITEILLADTNASIATTKASEASASALAALSSQNAAATSANTAASLLDQFDDRYLGAKVSDPTLDNDGNALLVGALYFNSSSNQLKVWNGSAWNDSALQLNNTLTSTSTTQALTAAQGKVLQDSKEPAFTKNTGFNKNLGTSAGTVLEGSHYGSTGAVHGVATTSVAGFMSASDKVKLDGVATGAEVNQNSFSNIAVSGQTTVAADTKTDTLTLVAGTNVTITTDAVTDSVTISANDTSVAFSEITGKPTSLSGYGITDGQPLDATLTALAGVTTTADKLVYATGSDVFSTTTLTSFGRSLIDDADAATARTTLGTLPSANPSYTGTLTGGTGVVNLGSGQFVKDANGNVGIGVTPSAWASNRRVLEIKGTSAGGGSINSDGLDMNIWQNARFDGVAKYIANGPASGFGQYNGGYTWYTAPAGTAGNTINWTTAMTLNPNGNLLIGTTTDNGVDKLQVNGSISSNNTVVFGNSISNIWNGYAFSTNIGNAFFGIINVSALYTPNPLVRSSAAYLVNFRDNDSATIQILGSAIHLGGGCTFSVGYSNGNFTIINSSGHDNVNIFVSFNGSRQY